MSAEQEVEVNQGDMLMTCGAAGGLNVVMKSLLDPGDEVILLAPYFVEYNFYVDNHGGVSRIVPTDSSFNLDLAAIETAITENQIEQKMARIPFPTSEYNGLARTGKGTISGTIYVNDAYGKRIVILYLTWFRCYINCCTNYGICYSI